MQLLHVYIDDNTNQRRPDECTNSWNRPKKSQIMSTMEPFYFILLLWDPLTLRGLRHVGLPCPLDPNPLIHQCMSEFFKQMLE